MMAVAAVLLAVLGWLLVSLNATIHRQGTRVATARSSKQLFLKLRDRGGVHPLAQLVCFPFLIDQLHDTTFISVGFSEDFASTLRAKGKPVPQEFLDAEKASEKDHVLLEWVFLDGVRLQKEPATLKAVLGSEGTFWSADHDPPDGGRGKVTAEMVFGPTLAYSRDVRNVDGLVIENSYGQCEPIR